MNQRRPRTIALRSSGSIFDVCGCGLALHHYSQLDAASSELERHQALDRETRAVRHDELVGNQRLEVERQLKAVPSQIDPLNRVCNRFGDFAVGLQT